MGRALSGDGESQPRRSFRDLPPSHSRSWRWQIGDENPHFPNQVPSVSVREANIRDKDIVICLANLLERDQSEQYARLLEVETQCSQRVGVVLNEKYS